MCVIPLTSPNLKPLLFRYWTTGFRPLHAEKMFAVLHNYLHVLIFCAQKDLNLMDLKIIVMARYSTAEILVRM